MRAVLGLVGWNLGLLAGLLILAELVFGGWLGDTANSDLRRLSIYRDVTWQLSASDKYGRADTVSYRRDSFGFRGKYGTPADVAILAVGGSTTDERFVSEGETWTDVLSACLTERGAPTPIANAGVAGQSSRGHILDFDIWFRHVPALRPAVVLVYLGINEKVLDGRVIEDDVRRYTESGRPPWVERLLMKSALYGLVTTVRGNLAAWKAGYHALSATGGAEPQSRRVDRLWREASAQQVTVGTADHDRRRQAVAMQRKPELDAYAQRLRVLAETIQAFGAEPVFATQAGGSYRRVGEKISGNLDDYFELAAFNAVTLQTCGQLGLRCLDVGAKLEFSDGDLWDVVHTTPQGSRRVGAAMCESLLAAGIAPVPGRRP
ncbi:Lysophospholipase L1 and related esterases [Magnetospirillum sp. LM-5]|uniref:SGNH/GDSL hydrolase family protein n=1 Tax=Magnetospirillum sp. LM-5 TaxID=2681466 RepID=UPI001384855F|nr:SGNH/GDSL hydrolase family protein [Magnetospirillum sp. LM-5]CAA7622528.1 Lysophospholipase L1 and related esterases [Magnetospirillum sp. LM-5]